MIMFDVRELARNLLTPEDHPLNVREHLVKLMLQGALEIYNDPHRTLEILNEIEESLDNDYNVLRADKHIEDYLKVIQTKCKQYQWDPLIKGKLEYKTIGRGLHQAKVVMDMQETVARMMNDCGLDRPAEVHVTDIVCDNPGVELINELHPLRNGKTRGKVSSLSHSAAPNLRRPENGGWGAGRWDRYSNTAGLPLQLRGPQRTPEDD